MGDVERPNRGVIFWPVGTGDSTTVTVERKVTLQVDLNHKKKAGDDDPDVEIIDELERIVHTVNGKPYLSAFALTHPDLDHCRGFKDLLERFTIGEIWFTPRVFNECKVDLSEDAKAFKEEAERRLKKVIKKRGDVEGGDRLLVVGWDDILKEDPYEGLPEDCVVVPGDVVTSIDGTDHSDVFRAFIHAPFKDDMNGDRNGTSLAMQVRLTRDGGVLNTLLLGDHGYETIMAIFGRTAEDSDLAWDVLSAPHHCSKSAMYVQEEGKEGETHKRDVEEKLEGAGLDGCYIVSSSVPIPSSNKKGDNPPHAKAKRRYLTIVESDHFLCTGEHGGTESPKPIAFEATEEGLKYTPPKKKATKKAAHESLHSLVDDTRQRAQPPSQVAGFGRPK